MTDVDAVAPLLGDCGCCEGVEVVTPQNTENPPGADRLRYRVGTAATFLESMRARISTELPALRSRRPDDPTTALMDAWACALDVLTFYDERIITEAYLRTATEGLSVTDLARTVGYERAPGRAAATWLQFTLEDGVGAPAEVPVPTGTKVASLPGPGQVPQTFETVADVTARPGWNALTAIRSGSPLDGFPFGRLYVEGAATTIRPGETLLFLDQARKVELRTVRRVTPLPTNVTEVVWDGSVPVEYDAVHVLHLRAAVFGAAAPDWRSLPDSIRAHYEPPTGSVALFVVLPVEVDEWPKFHVSEDVNTLDLDSSYPALVPGGLVVLTTSAGPSVFTVSAVQGTARADFGLSARVTRLTLGSSMGAIANNSPRAVGVLAGSEQLMLTGAPLSTPVEGKVVDLVAEVTTLPTGRAVLVAGRAPLMRVDSDAVRVTTATGAQQTLQPGDLLTVTGPAQVAGGGVVWPVRRGADTGTVAVSPGDVTFLPAPDDQPPLVELGYVDHAEDAVVQLQQPLTGSYDRASLRIAANIAPATHGETKKETVGSGDATATFQHFTLAQSPLTYVGSTTTGVTSTLQVWVDGNRWEEVRSLYGSGPADRVYTVRIADDDKVTVCFGDGITGARLPSGSQNVAATYRVGTGLAGAVAAGQLTLLMTRPLGVRGVTNPMPAGLSADPDAPSMVRRNAPRTALAFDRVVSLLDFEDFVRAIPGFAKAQAAGLLLNGALTVHLTVVGEQGTPVSMDDQASLLTTIRNAGDPRQPLAIDSADQVGFYVRLTVVVDPASVPGAVKAAVKSALLEQFGFDARDLGQPVTATEVLAVAQRVPGVVAVNLTLLDIMPGGDRLDVLPARSARSDGTSVAPAQLLTVRPDGIDLVESA